MSDNIKCLVNIKMHLSLWENIFVELLLASDCTLFAILFLIDLKGRNKKNIYLVAMRLS